MRFCCKGLYGSESATYAAVFPDSCAFKSGGERTIVGYKDKACGQEALHGDISGKLATLKEFVPYAEFAPNAER